MNRTGTDDGEQSIVTTMQHVANLLTGGEHEIAHLVGEGQFLEKISRGGNRVKLSNVDIHGLRETRRGHPTAVHPVNYPDREDLTSLPLLLDESAYA